MSRAAIPNESENLDFRPSQSLGVGRSQLARISNTGDIAIVPTARAFASVQNQIFRLVRYIILSLAVLAAGCQNQDAESIAIENERVAARPVVALAPIIDSSSSELPWNLSEELTATIHERLHKKEKLHLIEEDKIRAMTQKLTSKDNPFANNIEWVKNTFAHDDFVVFVELIEHEEVPLQGQRTISPKECSYELNMTARVRIVDLRGTEPEIILQELIHDTHFIPKRFSRYNQDQIIWGQDNFNISPVGLAHSSLSKEIAKRVEDYILLANKNIVRA